MTSGKNDKNQSNKRTASTEKLEADHKNVLESTEPQRVEELLTRNQELKQRSQSNLNRCGRKLRTVLTEKEIAFCVYFVLSGDAKYSSIQAGFNPWRGYELLKLPRIQAALPEFETRKKEECWGDANKKTRLMREGADEAAVLALQIILRKMKTDPTVVGMLLAKLIEIIYKRTGDIGQKVTPADQYAPQYAAQRAGNTQGFKSGVFYTPAWVRKLYGIHDPRSEALERKFGLDPVSGELLTSSKDNSSSDTIKPPEACDNHSADTARELVHSVVTVPPRPPAGWHCKGGRRPQSFHPGRDSRAASRS